MIFLDGIVKGYKLLVRRALVADADGGGVYKFYNAGTFGRYLRAAVPNQLTLYAGAHDRRLATHQRHCLAHHVRSHKCAVGIIMLQERNKRCCYGCYLCRRHVHEVDLIGRYHREVGIQTSLDSVVLKCSIFIDGSITLCDNLTLLDFSRHIDYLIVLQVDFTVLDLAIRSLDKAEVVDLAYTHNELIRPMLGPSGVSIGHRRP